jgi:uncharacterized membrane protein (DUF106 family)
MQYIKQNVKNVSLNMQHMKNKMQNMETKYAEYAEYDNEYAICKLQDAEYELTRFNM